MSRSALRRYIHDTWRGIKEEAVRLGAHRVKDARLPATLAGIRLLTLPEGQTKLLKGAKKGWLQVGLNLSPHKESGFNMCPWEAGCAGPCLKSAGRNRFDESRNARLWKTALFLGNPVFFRLLLKEELRAHIRRADRLGMWAGFRPNLLSDQVELADHIASWAKAKGLALSCYDYTKSIDAAFRSAEDRVNPCSRGYVWRVASFSSSPDVGFSWAEADLLLALGGSVSVVFSGGFPEFFRGWPTLDGDASDVRGPSEGGYVVALVLKGDNQTKRAAGRLAMAREGV